MPSRRTFLKWLGFGGAAAAAATEVPFGKAREAAAGKAAIGIAQATEWKFVPYLSPNLVGYKGYWYLPEVNEWVDEDGHKHTWTTKNIMAFETLDGKKLATPWAIQMPDYREQRRVMQSRLRRLHQEATAEWL